MKIRQAVILAGGQGTRLRPLTLTTPKPLIPVAGKPFVQHLVEYLRDNGIEEIVFLTSYLAEQFPAYFGDGSKFGLSIKYSESLLDDESGARVLKAKDVLDETFLLLYGDNFWPIPVQEISDYHTEHGKLVTIAAFNNTDGSSEYGFEHNLTVKDGMLAHYGPRGSGENAIDVGTFVVEKRALEQMPAGNPIFQRDLLNTLIPQKQVAAYQTDIPYCFITSLDLIPRAEEYIRAWQNHSS